MKTKEFSFNLPPELIAQQPALQRAQSRLMIVNPRQQTWHHGAIPDLVEQIAPGTVMVLNDTRVRKARLFAQTQHGGQVEVVFLRPGPAGQWECLVNKAKKLKAGQSLKFPESVQGVIETESGNVRRLRFEPEISEDWLERWGHLPLPPYIQRPDSAADEERYQTVYARERGSAAAPTAGLHFSPELLERLRQRGVELVFVTLEVGLGTFLPVRAETVQEHTMHTERYHLTAQAAEQLTVAKAQGRPILAVGTTSLRTLESVYDGQGFAPGWGQTSIFIYPGYQFRAVDQLFTNFHTPESTLLMLVSAFAGKDFLLRAYAEAVAQRYRFFSYGDAMLLLNRSEVPSP